MEETVLRPKPMVEIGGRPMLWHIMQLYARQGFDDFIIAAGYKGDSIKRYFMDYRLLNSDLTLHFGSGAVEVRSHFDVRWRVQVVDTGNESLTGGRLLRLESFLRDGPFMVTYGDGLADIDLRALRDFHLSHDSLATVTAVRPPEEPRSMLEEGRVAELDAPFRSGWINGGFFVFEPGVMRYVRDDSSSLEESVLPRLAADGQLQARRHDGFWQCMDTPGDRASLESIRQWQPAVVASHCYESRRLAFKGETGLTTARDSRPR